MAEYYLGIWHDKPKPLELYKKKKGSYPNAMRQVPAQPNTFGAMKFNIRKMNELPHHLTKCGRFDEFVTHICRNYDFLYYKCFATSIDTLLSDMRAAMIKLDGQEGETCAEQKQEIKLLYDILVIRSDVIRKDPLQFPGQVCYLNFPRLNAS